MALFASFVNSNMFYYLHLPILLVIVSLVYSATRFDDWKLILTEAVRWGSKMAIFLGSIVVVLQLVAIFLR